MQGTANIEFDPFCRSAVDSPQLTAMDRGRAGRSEAQKYKDVRSQSPADLLDCDTDGLLLSGNATRHRRAVYCGWLE